jgi:hypothetical protein
MLSKKKDDKEYARDHTDQLYKRFLNLAINRFKWSNLPPGLTSRKLEEYLIKHGQAMFYKNEEGALVALPCSPSKNYTVYGEPRDYITTGFGYTGNVNIDDGIVIRNNAMCTNDYDDLMLFAERINEVEQTMDINLFHQNTPYVILCDEKERLTFKNILHQVREFKFAIFGRKGLTLDSKDILDTKAEFLLDKLQEHKNSLMNELLTYLGINNNNVNKKERVVVDEVNANNDFILVNIDHMFDERQLACEEINKKFNLKIKVEKREVNVNGNLHSGTEDDN